MAKKGTVGATVGAAEFKARCLELIDRVKESRTEYVITRHGRPVAKLVPIDAHEATLGQSSGAKAHCAVHRPFDPIPGTWSLEVLLHADE